MKSTYSTDNVIIGGALNLVHDEFYYNLLNSLQVIQTTRL